MVSFGSLRLVAISFTYQVLRGDVCAVEGEGGDRLDVSGRRGQVEGGAAVLQKEGRQIVVNA